MTASTRPVPAAPGSRVRYARRTLGVLGGMGPLAGAEFFRKISSVYPARRDQEHPVVHLLSDPRIGSRSDAVLGEDPASRHEVERGIREGVEALIALGADVVAVPCNTAHHFIDRFHDEVFAAPGAGGAAPLRGGSLPVLAHIVDATLDRVAESPEGGGWLLATHGTIRSGVYTARAAARGLALRVPDAGTQDQVDRCIDEVKAGRPADAARLAGAIARSLAARADVPLVAACTELPIALDAAPEPIPHISSIDALVSHTIRLLVEDAASPADAA